MNLRVVGAGCVLALAGGGGATTTPLAPADAPRTVAEALDVTAGATGVWVLSQLAQVQGLTITDRGSRLERIDPATGRALRRIDLPVVVGELTQGRSGRLWVTGTGLAVVDPGRGRVTRVPSPVCGALVADAGPGIWTVSTCATSHITRRHADGRPAAASIRTPGRRPLAVVLGVDGLFIARAGRGASGPGGAVVRPGGPGVLERRDPRTGRLLRRAAVGPSPTRLVPGGGSLWCVGSDAILRRIDPRTLRTTARFKLPRTGSEWRDLAVGLGGPRVVDSGFGIARIDPRRQTVSVSALAGIPRGMVPIALAAGRRSLWAVVRDDGTGSAVCRVDPGTDRSERCLRRS